MQHCVSWVRQRPENSPPNYRLQDVDTCGRFREEAADVIVGGPFLLAFPHLNAPAGIVQRNCDILEQLHLIYNYYSIVTL